ncbi:MAG: hypothetical protein J6P46_05720 [Bacteroidales bacterium]|nr:hypothetical protein [Bacteroidales bacterium]
MHKTEAKETYITPACEVLIIQPEGVIAASGDPKYPDSLFGEEKPWSS